MLRQLTLLCLFSSLLVFSSSLHATEPQNIGPKIIKMKMGKKALEFTHHKHQQLTNNQCWECHDTKSKKIESWGESTAHKLCIPCHDLNEKGPITCKGCHKK